MYSVSGTSWKKPEASAGDASSPPDTDEEKDEGGYEDEDFEDDDFEEDSDQASSTGHEDEARRPAPEKPPPRAPSPAPPSQQPSLANGITADIQPAAPELKTRPSSSGEAQGTMSGGNSYEHPPLSVVYLRPPGSVAAARLLYSSHPPKRRHPNGLPQRQTTGPLPGMPFLSDLASRYPIRQAPAKRAEISLVSGQLYVGSSLQKILAQRNAAEDDLRGGGGGMQQAWPPAAQHGSTVFPGHSTLCAYAAGSFLEQRRQEKEQRAALAAQQSAVLCGWQPPSETVHYMKPQASCQGGADANGAGRRQNSPRGTTPKESARRESVERWLDEQSEPPAEHGAAGNGRPGSQGGSSAVDDPSLVYRQYGVFRTYGKQQPPPLRVTSSLPVLSRTVRHAAHGYGRGYGYGHVPEQYRKRATSGNGASPPRSAPQPAPARTQVLQNYW